MFVCVPQDGAAAATADAAADRYVLWLCVSLLHTLPEQHMHCIPLPTVADHVSLHARGMCRVACSNGAADQPQELLSPLDRARQALEADPIDASLMVSSQHSCHGADRCRQQLQQVTRPLCGEAHTQVAFSTSQGASTGWLAARALTVSAAVDACVPPVSQGELLAELEGEMFDLRDQLAQAAGAAAKAESLEGSLNSSKDQLLRLTADFENFRKRTVSSRGAQGYSSAAAAAAGTGPATETSRGFGSCMHVSMHVSSFGHRGHNSMYVDTDGTAACMLRSHDDHVFVLLLLVASG